MKAYAGARMHARAESSSRLLLAEREGFEPSVPLGTVAFKATAFVRSATVPAVTLATAVQQPPGECSAPTRRAACVSTGAPPRRQPQRAIGAHSAPSSNAVSAASAAAGLGNMFDDITVVRPVRSFQNAAVS